MNRTVVTTAIILIFFLIGSAAAFAFPQQELHRDETAPPMIEEPSEKPPAAPEQEERQGDQGEGSSEGKTEDESDERRDGDEDKSVFTYSISSSSLSFDPLHTFTSTEAQIYTALFEGLVSYHPFTLEPLPGIAERWEVSEDGETYTFHLRENAVYSNGDPILAEHVRDSWLALLHPEDGGEYASSVDMIKNARAYRNGLVEDPEKVGIVVEEDRRLRVELEHPASHFLKVLCHHSFAPLHPKMLERIPADDPSKLIGNGPFFISRVEDGTVILEKNELYWDKNRVALDELRLEYHHDPDETARLFNKGEVHWIDGNVNVDRLDDQSSVVVNPLFSTGYLFFSAQREVLSDPGVRRGLALLFPWAEIRSTRYMYLPTDSLVPQIDQYPPVDGIAEQNVERALELLEELGYPRGEGLGRLRLVLPEGQEALRIGELIHRTVEEHLEIGVSIRQEPFDEYYAVLQQGDFDMGMLTWIGDYADPLTFLGMWTSDSSLNLSQFRDQAYDELIDSSMRQEGSERYETLAEAEKHLLHGAVVLPLKHSPAFNIIDLRNIEGWFPNPLDIHPFKFIGFSRISIPDGVALI